MSWAWLCSHLMPSCPEPEKFSRFPSWSLIGAREAWEHSSPGCSPRTLSLDVCSECFSFQRGDREAQGGHRKPNCNDTGAYSWIPTTNLCGRDHPGPNEGEVVGALELVMVHRRH